MHHLHYSILINAPKEHVWRTMLEDATYRVWSEEFNKGSYYEGTWETGSDIRFLGPDKDGTVSGMIGKIAEARPYDFVSITYSGEIMQGKERIYTAEELGDGAFENYTFTEKDGGTQVDVDLDVFEAYKDMFEEMWPRALKKLKEITEA
jgi:uncharacterized protein YndB with AHSA1/START domain